MSEPRRPSGHGSGQPPWSQPTEPLGNQYPSADPAYAGTYNYPGYVPPNTSDPTRALPTYWTQTQYPQYPPAPQPEPPPPPKSPRWLWLVAGGAIVLVLGLVAALLIANSGRDSTVVAPLPPMPDDATTETTTARPTTTAPTPTTTPRQTTTSAPLPVPPGAGTTPGDPGESAATESVVYNVSGIGRAMSITYVDTGGVLQMEFNVVLPWSREVTLSPSTVNAASVTVVNVGSEVSCSVTVNGVEVQQRAGNGLTICAGRR